MISIMQIFTHRDRRDQIFAQVARMAHGKSSALKAEAL
jgi:hypothetical protein